MEVFSDRERKIIKILGRKRKTIREITEELFKGGLKPFDGEITVANSVRRIIKKCSYNDLNWTLVKTREDKKLTIKKERL